MHHPRAANKMKFKFFFLIISFFIDNNHFILRKKTQYVCIYSINLQTVAVSLFENSSVQLRSKEDLEGPECSNYC